MLAFAIVVSAFGVFMVIGFVAAFIETWDTVTFEFSRRLYRDRVDAYRRSSWDLPSENDSR